jgi:hypothetical protein
MARSRNIKPGFFQNEELVEIEPIGRLLYIGLWCLADREGRLEDRPKKIKAMLFPYENWDINSLLNDLAQHDFIIRYQVEGENYIWIPKFKLHQNPHPKEKPSIIPPVTKEIAELNGKTITSHEKQLASRADSLQSDSLQSDILIPDSLSIPYREIGAAFNEICLGLKKVRDITEKRKKAIKARWNTHPGIEFYREYFTRVQSSDFLKGKNDRNWMADFDWLMNEQNMAKVLEGRYDNRTPSNPKRPSGMADLEALIRGDNIDP